MKKSKSHPEILVDINTLSHDGRGVTTISGKTTFVHGALAGEKVRCKIIKQHRRYNESKVIEILTNAPSRVTAQCSHFGVCGGCSLQHMQLDSQIQFKQQTLIDQLKHFGRVSPTEIISPLSGNPWGYRGKARLGVKYVEKKKKVLVGFREKMSHYLAELTHCPILHPSIGSRLTALSELISSLTQYREIPQIEIAIGNHITACVFRHLTNLTEADIQKCRDFGQSNDLHIYLQPNPPQSVQKIWPEDGSNMLSYSLPDFNLDLLFHPLAFTQVNAEMNLLMIKEALRLLSLTDKDHVLDLFCGLGNFTLPMARFANDVIGIEGNHAMVTCASENAFRNQIQNAHFYTSNLMKPSEEDAWMQKQYHKILLDPPRSGAKEIIPYFPRFCAEKIVYVSCNPATLARDAGVLVHTQGYELKKAGIINMFPHTSHVEAIALFEK